MIGLGWVAQEVHLPNLKSIPELELAAVCDVDGEKVSKVASAYGCNGEQDYRTICERKDIEAVLVLTPPLRRLDLIKTAIENHKHVYCEKPLAESLESAEGIAAAVRKENITFMVGYNMRYSEYRENIKALLPALGRSSIELNSYWVGRDLVSLGYGRSYQDVARYTLFEKGTHLVDLLRWFFGDEYELLDSKMEVENGIDVWSSFSIRFKSASTHSEISTKSKSPDEERNTMTFVGEKGTLRHVTDGIPDSLTFTPAKGQGIIGQAMEIVGRAKLSSHVRALNHFVRCVQTGEEPLTNVEEALKSLELVFRIYSKAGHAWKLVEA